MPSALGTFAILAVSVKLVESKLKFQHSFSPPFLKPLTPTILAKFAL